MRYILNYEFGLNLGCQRVTYPTGKSLWFDGTTVQWEGGPAFLGFKDSSGEIHMYTTEDCGVSVIIPCTPDVGSLLAGATISEVRGMEEGSKKVEIITDLGILEMFRETQCCGEVYLLDVCGDPEDLIGGVIIQFELRKGSLTGKKQSSHKGQAPTQAARLSWREYTFYECRTTKGDVTLRWGEPDHEFDNRYGTDITMRLID